MIYEIFEALGSMTKTVEMISLLEGIKPAMRTIAPSGSLKNYSNLFSKYGLFVEVSDFKVISEYGEKNFSNKGYRIDRNSEVEGEYVLYISKNLETAKQLKAAEHFNDHAGVGKLLGYPKCCIKFFIDHNKAQEMKNNDYVMPFSKTGSFLLNVVNRYNDISLISHFPCSLRCEESMKIGMLTLEAVRKYSQKDAEFLEKNLKGMFVYSENQGVHKIGGQCVVSSVSGQVTVNGERSDSEQQSVSSITYSSVESNHDTMLKNDLMYSNKIIGNTIFFNDKKIRTYDMSVLRFV